MFLLIGAIIGATSPVFAATKRHAYANNNVTMSMNPLARLTKSKVMVGVVDKIYPDYLELKVKNIDYKVSLAPKAKILNRKGKSLNLSEIQTGDKIKVRIFGTTTGPNILASVIRDISLPRTRKHSWR